MRVVVVDGANVVGSRPDGWWRDRPGAAARLHERLVAAAWEEPVVLVLEGKARDGVPEGCHGTVRTVHAAGSGDDEIVAQARSAAEPDGAEVVVVTADRELQHRVAGCGAAVRTPSWLTEQLPGL